MMSDLRAAEQALTAFCGEATAVLAAVSGGLDSMCLLHVTVAFGRMHGLKVTAAHFNHQLREAESDRDEAFVRDWCAERGIAFVSGSGDVRALAAAEGLSLEEAARKARYAFLERQRQKTGSDYVLTAHHADDNAETMLLNLLRGTGLRGLTGIPEQRERIVRPFLSVTRTELAEYAEKHRIPHVEDSTNADPEAAARNLLRRQVMPVLKELNPKAVENMARTAKLLAQDETALQLAARDFLGKCVLEPEQAKLPIEACLRAEHAVLNRCIAEAMACVGGHRKDLSAVHVNEVAALLQKNSGKAISLPYGMAACREKDWLVIRKNGSPPKDVSLCIGQTVSFGMWTVQVGEIPDGQEISLPLEAELSVTAWHRKDRMTLPGSQGARSFKRLCVDRGIESAEREHLPVLRVDGRAAAAPGIGTDVEFLPQVKEKQVFIKFKKQTEESSHEK